MLASLKKLNHDDNLCIDFIVVNFTNYHKLWKKKDTISIDKESSQEQQAKIILTKKTINFNVYFLLVF